LDGIVEVPRVSRRDRLVRWDRAAAVLGVSEDGLMAWYRKGFLPAVKHPGLWMTYQSYIDAVLNGTRPGCAANVEEIGRRWFAEHVPTEEVA
jgi:hypothetical protein